MAMRRSLAQVDDGMDDAARVDGDGGVVFTIAYAAYFDDDNVSCATCNMRQLRSTPVIWIADTTTAGADGTVSSAALVVRFCHRCNMSNIDEPVPHPRSNMAVVVPLADDASGSSGNT